MIEWSDGIYMPIGTKAMSSQSDRFDFYNTHLSDFVSVRNDSGWDVFAINKATTQDTGIVPFYFKYPTSDAGVTARRFTGDSTASYSDVSLTGSTWSLFKTSINDNVKIALICNKDYQDYIDGLDGYDNYPGGISLNTHSGLYGFVLVSINKDGHTCKMSYCFKDDSDYMLTRFLVYTVDDLTDTECLSMSRYGVNELYNQDGLSNFIFSKFLVCGLDMGFYAIDGGNYFLPSLKKIKIKDRYFISIMVDLAIEVK